MDNIDYNVVQPKQSNDITRWHKLGQGRKSEKNFWIRLDVLPVANSDGEIWINLFERTDNEISKENVEAQKQEKFYERRAPSEAKELGDANERWNKDVI